MVANAFIGKTEQPSNRELAAELGPAQALWGQLLSDLASEYGADIQEWNSYSPKAGWSLRVKRLKRTVVYLSPRRGCFVAAFAMGDKAVQAAQRSELPASVVSIIKEARRYAEGTAVWIDVRTAKDIAVVKQLAQIKLEN